MKKRLLLNTESSDIYDGELFIELPTENDAQGRSYLWFGNLHFFLGTIENKRDLLKLRKMIDQVLETL